jgi:hypothetical protein
MGEGNECQELDIQSMDGHFVFIGLKEPAIVRKRLNVPDSIFKPSSSAYLRSKI